MTYEIGQTVMIRRVRGPMAHDVLRGEAKEARVVKVGRTRVTVEPVDGFRWSVPAQYRMDTGLEVGDFPGSRIDTPEVLADELRRVEITERLAKAGVRVTVAVGYGEPRVSTDALAEILDVVLRDQRVGS